MWYAQHNSRAATTTPTPNTSTPTTPTASRTATTSTDVFKHGIKHDPSLFPVMKQDCTGCCHQGQWLPTLFALQLEIAEWHTLH